MKFFLAALLLACVAAPLTAHAQIAPNIQRATIAGIDVLAYPTGVKDVVTFHGSLPAGDRFAPDTNVAIPTLVGEMLSQGTTSKDKFAIAQLLESVGATLNFSVGTTTVNFSGKCLRKDVPLVLGLLAEQLRNPAFDAGELEKLKKQLAGDMQRSLEDPETRAAEAFVAAIYPPGHPNRTPTTAEFLEAIPKATVADLRAFHAAYYGPAELRLVAVGDLDVPALKAEVARAFAGWTGGKPVPPSPRAGVVDGPRERAVFMADKTSVSVIIGQASGLKHSDPDALALRVGTEVLGSGFTSRLLGQVRDTEGLTYGIGAALRNDTYSDGDWRIRATFAPELLERGIASTQRHFKEWRDKGITAEELAKRKTNVAGTFKLAMATTDGLASSILNAVNRGYDPSWLDEYPKQIEALTLDEVNAALKKHLKPENFITIKAGTVVAPGK